MPIFRINDRLHFFAHVPKCGGTSVEHYLADRFGPLGFHESGRARIADDQLWTRSHAQHVPLSALYRVLPPDWFASSFAVVRHPVQRVISAYFQNRDTERRVPLRSDINVWFRTLIEEFDATRFRHSNLRPQTQLVPKAATIFHFENGLDQIIPHLDRLAGNTDGPRVMPSLNLGKWRTEEAPPQILPETLDSIATFYAEDFARFGYEVPSTVANIARLAALPKMAATGAPPVPQRRRLSQRFQRFLMRRAGL